MPFCFRNFIISQTIRFLGIKQQNSLRHHFRRLHELIDLLVNLGLFNVALSCLSSKSMKLA